MLLAINQEESLTKVVEFMEDNDYSFPVLLDTDYAVSLEYGVSYIPIIFFIDKDGIIQIRRLGAFQSTADIEKYLNFIMP